jgi:hypothetical protein
MHPRYILVPVPGGGWRVRDLQNACLSQPYSHADALALRVWLNERERGYTMRIVFNDPV